MRGLRILIGSSVLGAAVIAVDDDGQDLYACVAAVPEDTAALYHGIKLWATIEGERRLRAEDRLRVF